jgi:isopentenyl diphosphate isomerase/L-lactate dehydrogenase-like FMN-dependent dehydrogenase
MADLEHPVKSEPIPDGPSGQSVSPARVGVEDFEAGARQILSQMVFEYYAGAAGDEWTLRENRRAFERWAFRPRVLVDVAEVDLSSTVLGQPIPFPIGLAPTAFQRLAHPEGEMATARAAASLGALVILSTISTTTIEDMASTGVHRWFQLYVMRDHELTAGLVKRAHAAGYGAIVVTVDTPRLGRRHRDERNRFTLPTGMTMVNLEMPLDADGPAGAEPGSSLAHFFAGEHDHSLTWDDIAWLRALSPLPLVLKGILTAEDARLAVEAGVDGIIVSNHGGRQLDGAPATLDALPEVAEAVGGRIDVLMDGGIRRGSDVLKALALGARAVLIGRPYLWGLAVDGEQGVRSVISMLRDELTLAMQLVGRTKVSDLDRSLVQPAPGWGQAR